jgi:hypothetical protein
MAEDTYGRYLRELRNLKTAVRRLERISPDKFYSLPDQGGWHLMSRVAVAAEELLEETLPAE